jgi:MFS family permease
VLVAPVAKELGWDKAAINGAYSLMILVSGFAGFGIGRALDRFGARTLMSAGSLILGVSLILLSRVQTLAQFDLIWGIGFGLGTALTFYPVSFTVVANWFEQRRMTALALLTFFGALASVIFYPLNGVLVAFYGWREATVILGVIQILITFPLHALIVRRHPEDLGLSPDGSEREADNQPALTGTPLEDAVRSRAFWLITASISLSFFAGTAVTVEHIAYLISRGFAPQLVATIVGLWGVAYLPGRTLVANAGRRIRLQYLLAVFFVLEAIGILILLGAHSLFAIVAYLLVFSGAYGAIAPLRAAIMAEQFGRRAYGAIIAAQGIPVAILSALGPFVCGRLVDVLGYAASFEGCVAALVLGALLMVVPLPRYSAYLT